MLLHVATFRETRYTIFTIGILPASESSITASLPKMREEGHVTHQHLFFGELNAVVGRKGG